mgnify:CR=1 FL=1
MLASHKPFLIAGPCGAESEEQMIQIAEALRDTSIQMIRAGIWKPRSRPGFFEGHGAVALSWMQKVKDVSGKLVCVEVANAKQVEKALDYGMDALWIGARTTVNPFVVQEICSALSGVDIPIMVKNPINPDVELWAGAIERFMLSGHKDLAAIHRGFSSYDPSSVYRNKPIWALPIELKRRFVNLPVFCDPSHIAGKRALVAEVAQRAMDLDFDGLMIETHPDPESAMSDVAQQLTPRALVDMLSNIYFRSKVDNSLTVIENIRQVLDTMDAEIVSILSKRMEKVTELASIKEKYNMPIFQQERWREIVESRTRWGAAQGLDEVFILKLFELIHDKSIKTQLDTLQNKSRTKTSE